MIGDTMDMFFAFWTKVGFGYSRLSQFCGCFSFVGSYLVCWPEKLLFFWPFVGSVQKTLKTMADAWLLWQFQCL